MAEEMLGGCVLTANTVYRVKEWQGNYPIHTKERRIEIDCILVNQRTMMAFCYRLAGSISRIVCLLEDLKSFFFCCVVRRGESRQRGWREEKKATVSRKES
jgi:hypothetical protein